jgi:hypothetical protein
VVVLALRALAVCVTLAVEVGALAVIGNGWLFQT